MRTPATALLTLLTSFLLTAQSNPFDTLLPRLMAEGNVPGLSLAVVDKGQLAYTGALGVRSLDSALPLNGETVFAAASLSKPVFAYAVLQLVEEGALDLDRPLHEYLPYEDIAHDARYKQITARQVLSHSTGFPNWRNDSLRILFTPGERFSYSGEGFVYLQRVVEKITGRPIDDVMTDRVFRPLGMMRSSYTWRDAYDGNYAVPHDELGRTYVKYKPEEGNVAHSLQTTATDYARFLLAIFNGKGLKEASIRDMLSPQISVPEKYGRTNTTHPRLSWGLGWGLDETPRGRVFWHWGDNGAFKCFVAANPARKSAVAYFANSSGGLTIAPAILAASPVGPVDATNWLNYGTHDQPGRRLLKAIVADGFDTAIESYLMPGKPYHDTTRINESDMNSLGYTLLNLKRIEDARRAFWSNVQAYPHSANVYDSYAEACLVSGRHEEAARYYAEALARNPASEVARRVVEQFTQPLTGNTTFRLEGYPNARLVSLAGDFNGWSEWKHIMRREEGVWVCRLDLKPGKYLYKFVVDGVWIVDPANPATEYGGHHNSVRTVER